MIQTQISWINLFPIPLIRIHSVCHTQYSHDLSPFELMYWQPLIWEKFPLCPNLWHVAFLPSPPSDTSCDTLLSNVYQSLFLAHCVYKSPQDTGSMEKLTSNPSCRLGTYLFLLTTTTAARLSGLSSTDLFSRLKPTAMPRGHTPLLKLDGRSTLSHVLEEGLWESHSVSILSYFCEFLEDSQFLLKRQPSEMASSSVPSSDVSVSEGKGTLSCSPHWDILIAASTRR